MTVRDFTVDEFIRSETATERGLNNTPPASILANIQNVLMPGMQRVRDLLGVPVLVSSGYRSPAVNAAVGGAGNSQHTLGLAADFHAPAFGDLLTIARFIEKNVATIRFDQLIFEGTWVHVSFVSGTPRGQVLTAHFGHGPTTYTAGL